MSSSGVAVRLDAFEALVRKWNPRINLISPASLADLRGRHIEDSAQIFDIVGPREGIWADLGSGGGFPGVVIAILAHDLAPGLRVVCIESDQRKCAFLNTAIRELGLAATVVGRRIEEVPPLGASVVSARALAPLAALVPLALRHLAPGGLAIFPKGARHAMELDEARQSWRFDLETVPSRTQDGARLLMLRNIERA